MTGSEDIRYQTVEFYDNLNKVQMTMKFNYIIIVLVLLFFTSNKVSGQISGDTTVCLIRYNKDKVSSYKIPLTKYFIVEGAGIVTNRDWPGGWVMKWDVAEKTGSNLLFLEMNSTDVSGWLGNNSVAGSVQLVLEMPTFSDSFSLTKLSYKTKGLSIINNYAGTDSKREFIQGSLKLTKNSGVVYVSSSINLHTAHPDTKQQIILNNHTIPSLTYIQYEELEQQADSAREAEKADMVNEMTELIAIRDSIWNVENQRINDSLKLHPYKGTFRFWISDIIKYAYLRRTYCFTADSLIIKEGPYDFIYLAKNYSKDVVSFRKSLSQSEKERLSAIEKRIGSDSLSKSYFNICIMDGQNLSFSFESASFSKDVTVSNYYNETIAFVIDLVNTMTPKKYRLWYDKEFLLKQQNACDWQRKQ